MSAKSNRSLKTSLVCSAVLTALATAATPLYAAGEEASADADDSKIESIMVTSRKRAETIIEVPMSVSTISAMEISDRNLVNKEDVYRSIAGAANPRGELILRGLAGSNDSTPGTTTTFTDGIPYDFSDLYDVERLEILRGPQGTLYGSNAIGGTVRIMTKKPQLGEFEVNGSFQMSNQARTPSNELRGYGAINIPLGDEFALRVTGSVSEDPKPTVNVNTGVQGYDRDQMLRTQLLWQASDDVTVNVAYIHDKNKNLGTSNSDLSTGFNSGYVANLTANPDAPFGYDVSFSSPPDCNLSRVQCLSDGPVLTADPKYAIYEDMDRRGYEEADIISLSIEDENFFDIGSLSYVGSYRETRDGGMQNWSRTDGQDMFRTWIIDDYSNKRTTHEIRLQNLDTESPLDWTVGFFYDKTELGDEANEQFQYHGDGDEGKAIATALWGGNWWYLRNQDTGEMGREYFSVDGNSSATISTIAELGMFYWNDPNINYSQHAILDWEEEKALFADVAYTFDLDGDAEIELNAGIRFFDLEDANEDLLIGIWNGPTPTRSTGAGSEDGHRLKFSASYRPSSDMSVYALYSEGYRPGGNNLPSLPQSCNGDPDAVFHSGRYESDEISNYELGYKAVMMDRKLRVAGAVYRIEWDGVQVPIRLGCGFGFTANAASAQTQGFELETTYALTDTLNMTLNYGYTSAEMTADVPALRVKDGDEMTMVPKYNGYLAFDQEYELFGRTAYVRADVNVYAGYNSYFQSEAARESGRADLDYIDGYSVFNLSTRVEVNEATTLSVYIDNLFDKEYAVYKRAANLGYSGQHLVTYGQDRTLTVRMDYRF